MIAKDRCGSVVRIPYVCWDSNDTSLVRVGWIGMKFLDDNGVRPVDGIK
jgi:hypothetical protein